MDLERIPESHWFLAKLYIPILYTALSYKLHNIGLLMDDKCILVYSHTPNHRLDRQDIKLHQAYICDMQLVVYPATKKKISKTKSTKLLQIQWNGIETNQNSWQMYIFLWTNWTW